MNTVFYKKQSFIVYQGTVDTAGNTAFSENKQIQISVPFYGNENQICTDWEICGTLVTPPTVMSVPHS